MKKEAEKPPVKKVEKADPVQEAINRANDPSNTDHAYTIEKDQDDERNTD